MSRGLGYVQRRILEILSGEHEVLTALEIAGLMAPSGAAIDRSLEESVRRALESLVDRGLILDSRRSFPLSSNYRFFGYIEGFRSIFERWATELGEDLATVERDLEVLPSRPASDERDRLLAQAPARVQELRELLSHIAHRQSVLAEWSTRTDRDGAGSHPALRWREIPYPTEVEDKAGMATSEGTDGNQSSGGGPGPASPTP